MLDFKESMFIVLIWDEYREVVTESIAIFETEDEAAAYIKEQQWSSIATPQVCRFIHTLTGSLKESMFIVLIWDDDKEGVTDAIAIFETRAQALAYIRERGWEYIATPQICHFDHSMS